MESISEVAKTVEEKVIAPFIAVSTEEKLIARELEAQFLRLTLDIQAAQHKAEEVKAQFETHVRNLAAKYAVNPAEHTYNMLKAEFTKIEKAL